MTRFRDRRHAGQFLAEALAQHAGSRPIVLGLPRGGVVVAGEVARALGAPLDVWVVRKLGVPWHGELGFGAVCEGGHVYLAQEMLRHLRLSQDEIDGVIAQQRVEVERRVRLLRGGRARPEVAGCSVILVDDGIATGGTVRAAVQALRREEPREIILAVPVAAAETLSDLKRDVDKTVCLVAPDNLYAIGQWYDDFEQVSDDEVVRILVESGQRAGTAPEPGRAHAERAG